MLDLLIVVSHHALQIFLKVLLLLDLEFVFVGQLPRHYFVVEINDAVFLNDFQVSLLSFIEGPLFMLKNAVLIGLSFHLLFGEPLLLLSHVKHFLVMPIFSVFLDLLVRVFLVILMRQSH